MQSGTPRGDRISTEAGLQAPSVATLMDGPEAAPVWEMGGKPVPAEAVQDDHVVCLQVHCLAYSGRHPVALEVRVKDPVWTSYATGGDGGLHLGGQEEVCRQP